MKKILFIAIFLSSLIAKGQWVDTLRQPVVFTNNVFLKDTATFRARVIMSLGAHNGYFAQSDSFGKITWAPLDTSVLATVSSLRSYIPFVDTGSVIPTFADTFKTIATIKKIPRASGTRGDIQYSIGGVFSSNHGLSWNDTYSTLYVTDSLGDGAVATNALSLYNFNVSNVVAAFVNDNGLLDILYSLPPTQGTVGQVLTSDGNTGYTQLSWTSPIPFTPIYGTGNNTSTYVNAALVNIPNARFSVYIDGLLCFPTTRYTYVSSTGTFTWVGGSVLSTQSLAIIPN
jgi:hypothetical protein